MRDCIPKRSKPSVAFASRGHDALGGIAIAFSVPARPTLDADIGEECPEHFAIAGTGDKAEKVALASKSINK